MTDPRPAVEYLRSVEWSMGNGQCPACRGVHPGWFGHPLYLTPGKIGHKLDCEIAAALLGSGETALRLGDFKSDKAYETCLTNGFLDTKVVGDPLRDGQLAATNWTGRPEMAAIGHLCGVHRHD